VAHSVHHVHLFASNAQETIDFYRNFFGGRVVLDMEIAGARNVFIQIGSGRIHLYDQPPKVPGAGSIHHFGIQTDDVSRDYEMLQSAGVSLRKPVTDLGYMKYVMVPAPDGVLIELFEVNKSVIPQKYHEYFS